MIKCHVIGKNSDGGGYWYKIPTNNNKAQQSRAPILWYVVYMYTCRLVFINDRNIQKRMALFCIAVYVEIMSRK